MIVRPAEVGLAVAAMLATFALLVWPPATPRRDGRAVQCATPIWHRLPDAAHHMDHPEDDDYCDARVSWRFPLIAVFGATWLVLCIWGKPIRYPDAA
jgi:hypothetical protein